MRPGSFPALAVLALALPAPLRAAADGGTELVLSLGAGVYVPTQDNGGFVYDPSFGVGLSSHPAQPGVALEAAVSAWWGFLGARASVGWLGASWEQASIGLVPVTGLLRARLRLGSVAPYLEGGAGACFVSVSSPAQGTYPAVVPALSGTATALEWIAGAGADLDLGSVRLGASVRYLWIAQEPLSVPDQPALRYRAGLRLDGLTFTLGVGYRFPLGGE